MSSYVDLSEDKACEVGETIKHTDYIYDIGQFPVKSSNLQRFRDSYHTSRPEYSGHAFGLVYSAFLKTFLQQSYICLTKSTGPKACRHRRSTGYKATRGHHLKRGQIPTLQPRTKCTRDSISDPENSGTIYIIHQTRYIRYKRDPSGHPHDTTQGPP